MKSIIRDLQNQITQGSSLREAFGKHPDVFSPFFLGMIEGSESSGTLDIVLERIATQLEKQEALRRKVRGAFTYPLVVVALCFLVVTFIIIFIVPVFASAYEKLGLELPGPTLALVSISHYVRDYWWAMIGVLAAGWYAWYLVRSAPQVKAALNGLKMNAPLVGTLNRKVALCRFIRNFATMTRVGVPLIKSIQISEAVAESYLISKAALAIESSVKAGGSIL